MKIKVDKEYTAGYQVERVKSDIDEFKGRYTDGDIQRQVDDMICAYNSSGSAHETIYISGRAFPAGYYYGNETAFEFDVMCECFEKVYKVRFYCDIERTVKSYSVKEYLLKKEA